MRKDLAQLSKRPLGKTGISDDENVFEAFDKEFKNIVDLDNTESETGSASGNTDLKRVPKAAARAASRSARQHGQHRV